MVDLGTCSGLEVGDEILDRYLVRPQPRPEDRNGFALKVEVSKFFKALPVKAIVFAWGKQQLFFGIALSREQRHGGNADKREGLHVKPLHPDASGPACSEATRDWQSKRGPWPRIPTGQT